LYCSSTFGKGSGTGQHGRKRAEITAAERQQLKPAQEHAEIGGVRGSNTAAHVSEIDPQKADARVRRAPVIAAEDAKRNWAGCEYGLEERRSG